MARRLLGTRDQIVVEGFADRGDSDKNAASLARASRVRLIRYGVPPDCVVAVGRGSAGARGRGAGGAAPPPATPVNKQGRTGARPPPPSQDPTELRTSVRRCHERPGRPWRWSRSSKEADGEVVYPFDPETPHGDESSLFRDPAAQPH
jgi:hypothetical protein